MEFKLIKQKEEVKISSNKKLLGYCNIDLLETCVSVVLNEKLNNKELDNLKYLTEENELVLEKDAIFSFKEIINKLKELGKNNKIIIDSDCKKNICEFIINQSIPDYENVIVKSNSSEISLKKYVYFETLLYKIIEPAKNLSPFEKYIYAYNIVKNFKEYKESQRRTLSRDIYQILTNEYIVCSGFSEFLHNLLFKLDISSTKFSIKGKNKDNSLWSHMRLYVNINDDKYGINGFYISDPTWDNNLEVDYYNHLLLTNKEAGLECDFYYSTFDNTYEIFENLNLDELYLKINNLFELRITFSLFEIIKKLDPNYYNYLNNRYDINKYNKKLVNDISLYIYNRLNNEVLGDTIMAAVEVVYRHSYGYKEEELQDKLEEVRSINSKRQNCLFPSKIRANSDAEADIIFLQNKFEKSSNKISKY